MSWHFLFLILAFADSASISCDQESAEDAFVQLSPAHARKRRTSESNLKIQLLGAFTGGKLCGQIVATPCTSPTLDVTDPVVSLCCERFSFRELGDVCEDFTPGCQAQKAACEMALFLCDDANPLLQPQFFVEPGTFPWGSQFSDMGGYNLNLWQALQNLTAICFGDGYEWLRSQSNYIKTRSGNVDRACQGIGQECELDPKSADSTEEGDESMERMQHILVESGTAAGGLVILAAMDFTPAGAIASQIFKTAMGLALGTTSGPPTNPCTYAGKDWGQCVWYQVRQYVERYVTSYVKEALEKYNEGQLEDRLRQIDTQVKRVKQDYRDQVRSNESLENVIEELQDLRSRLVGEAAWFLDSELLPQIFGISVTVQTLALSAGDLRTASSLMTLPASALCFAKALLKRGTYFMQNRMSELKATQVNRTSLRGDGHHWRYYYKGQFDAQCQTTEHDALKHSPYICDPGYGVSNAPHHTFPQNRQGEGECGVAQKHGNPRWKEWLCHQAYVRRVQQKIWARFVGSVVSLVELALNQSSMSKLPWVESSWVCSEGIVSNTVAALADLNNPYAGGGGAMVQMQAQCPFEVVTTYDFKESLSSKGSGDDMPLTMWSPKLQQGQNEYFVGDVCQNNWKANLEFTNSFVLKLRQGHEDALQTPTGMLFVWNNHDTDSKDGHDFGIWTPECGKGYVAVGSVGENFLQNDNFGPGWDRYSPWEGDWPGLMCVKEEYTESVSLDKWSWDWAGHGKYRGQLFVGKAYNTADGVLVNGPCHGQAGHDADDFKPYQVYQLKESLVKWCTVKPANSVIYY